MSLEFKNQQTTEINYRTDKKIREFVKDDALLNLLPPKPYVSVSFEIHNAYSAFANTIRRYLLSEIPCWSLNFDLQKVSEAMSYSGSGYILIDRVQETLQLIPIDQGYEGYESRKNPGISLVVHNSSESHMTITTGQFIDDKKLITDPNIPFISLEPKAAFILKSEDIFVEQGRSSEHARFSIMNGNVEYKVLDEDKHFDQFSKKGLRSIEKNPTNFYIKFQLKGNISVATVLKLLKGTMKDRLKYVKSVLKSYIDSKNENYQNEDIKTEIIQNDIVEIVFFKNSFEEPMMIAQKCHMIDPNGLHYSAAPLRYDSNESKLRFARGSKPNLMKAIELIEQDIEKIKF